MPGGSPESGTTRDPASTDSGSGNRRDSLGRHVPEEHVRRAWIRRASGRGWAGVKNNRRAWPPFHGTAEKAPDPKPGLQVQGHSLESSPDGTNLVAEDGRATWGMRVGLKMISRHDLPGNMLGRPHILSGHLEESLATFRGLVAVPIPNSAGRIPRIIYLPLRTWTRKDKAPPRLGCGRGAVLRLAYEPLVY
jgi:hypothetical protein